MRAVFLLLLGFLLFGLWAMTARAQAGRKAVVLSTDCGAEVDDQWALAHLALSPEVDLKGVITTHAPGLPAPAAESSARAAREVLDRLPLRARPPVVAGSSLPLADADQPRPSAAVTFLLEQARGHSSNDRLTVLMIGAATDVASALLTDPSLADRIAVIAMAFNAWPEGTDPFNVKNDVKAWQVVLGSRMPLVVGDTAVTKRHLLMTRARARETIGGHGEGGAYLVGLLSRWLDRDPDFIERISGTRDGWPIWDEVVTAHLLGLTRTKTHPRPVLRDDLTFDHSHPRGTIDWITEIDERRLWNDLAAQLDRARREAR